MKRFEKILSGTIIGGTFPILLGLLSIGIWFYADKSENSTIVFLNVGILSGFLIDLIFLRKWITRRFDLPLWFVAGIYVFYNICVFGFFMGVPIFNLLMGFVAAYYFGTRLISKKVQPKIYSRHIHQVSLFTALVMALICASSAFIALTDRFTGNNLQGMLGLDFEVTQAMIYVLVFVGGFGLIVFQYYVTKLTLIRTLRLNN